MATSNLRSLSLALGCALLGSCLGGGGAGDDGGGGGGGSSVCTSITGGASSVTADVGQGCFGCTHDGDAAAADGDLTTSATVTVPVSFAGQGVSLRATAQSGIVFPAGQQAAVFFVSPTSGGINPPDRSVTFRTLLAGQEQDAPSSYTTVLQDPANGKPYTFKGFVTTKPFDAVEVMVSDTEAAGTPWQINEICSDAVAPQ